MGWCSQLLICSPVNKLKTSTKKPQANSIHERHGTVQTVATGVLARLNSETRFVDFALLSGALSMLRFCPWKTLSW
jgi:hypothetical protein